MYGIEPMRGSGPVLVVTVEVISPPTAASPFELSGSLNEGRIPLRILPGASEVPPRPGRSGGPRRLEELAPRSR
jgi:hypothetical protein